MRLGEGGGLNGNVAGGAGAAGWDGKKGVGGRVYFEVEGGGVLVGGGVRKKRTRTLLHLPSSRFMVLGWVSIRALPLPSTSSILLPLVSHPTLRVGLEGRGGLGGRGVRHGDRELLLGGLRFLRLQARGESIRRRKK